MITYEKKKAEKGLGDGDTACMRMKLENFQLAIMWKSEPGVIRCKNVRKHFSFINLARLTICSAHLHICTSAVQKPSKYEPGYI